MLVKDFKKVCNKHEQIEVDVYAEKEWMKRVHLLSIDDLSKYYNNYVITYIGYGILWKKGLTEKGFLIDIKK